jgi:hypothetical protein
MLERPLGLAEHDGQHGRHALHLTHHPIERGHRAQRLGAQRARRGDATHLVAQLGEQLGATLELGEGREQLGEDDVASELYVMQLEHGGLVVESGAVGGLGRQHAPEPVVERRARGERLAVPRDLAAQHAEDLITSPERALVVGARQRHGQGRDAIGEGEEAPVERLGGARRTEAHHVLCDELDHQPLQLGRERDGARRLGEPSKQRLDARLHGGRVAGERGRAEAREHELLAGEVRGPVEQGQAGAAEDLAHVGGHRARALDVVGVDERATRLGPGHDHRGATEQVRAKHGPVPAQALVDEAEAVAQERERLAEQGEARGAGRQGRGHRREGSPRPLGAGP